MELGRHLAELWRIRHGVAACAALAILAMLFATYKVSLLPPKLTPRALEMASASTEVLVDTPRSAVLDLRQDLFDITSMTNRAVLLGNIMASPPVLAYVGRRAQVPPDVIRAVTPRTPNSPRPLVEPGQGKKSSDLLRSTDQYRLNIEANPSVPILKVYSQAPSARAAGELANAAVDGLRDYLDQRAAARGLQRDKQVRLVQLGRARGAIINDGIRLDVMVLTFLTTFALCAMAAIFMSRVRRGFAQQQSLRRPTPQSVEEVGSVAADRDLAIASRRRS